MLRVTLKSSLYLTIVLTTAHIASASLLILLALPLWTKVALAASVAMSLAHALRHHALRRNRTSPVALELHEDDRAAVQMRDGEWHEARVLPTTFVTPLLTVINLKLPGRLRARHVVIVPDGVRADDFRALRVTLRWRYRSARRSVSAAAGP
jgi:toxin CptA